MADTFTHQAVTFIEKQNDRPFFLYFAPHDIHVPRVPHPRFVGKTAMGPRGDAIVQLDWEVGEVLAALERHGLTRDTLVILSSDNGPVINDGYRDDSVEKLGEHRPSAGLRGGKYSRFEAGTRVPFIVRWPAVIKPGTSDALFSHVDFVATFAALTGEKLADHDAPDSLDQRAALLGQSTRGRDYVIEHAGRLAIRDGHWKFIAPAPKGVAVQKDTNTETANLPAPQLYDLSADPGETKNLAEAEPARAAALAAQLDALQKAGHSRP
jgi:arylsulfatase A-like enzyme